MGLGMGLGLSSWVGSRAGFLLAALVVYLVAGGLLFQAIEWDDKEEELLQVTEEMEEDRAELLKVAALFNSDPC